MSLTRRSIAGALAGLAIAVLPPAAARAQTAKSGAIELVPHRAVYDLTLAKSSNAGNVSAVRGRMVYDFSGNTCEGYTLKFRQVSELDNGEGKVVLSDITSDTWEDAAAEHYRFETRNTIDGQVTDESAGEAERTSQSVTVSLTKPRKATVSLDADAAFPTDHMRRILATAREGKTILQVPVYDGADNGEKVYDTLTVIGAAIPADKPAKGDAAEGKAELAGLRRWPVTISYFEQAERVSEQTPVYSISLEAYANGVARALTLNYDTFSLKGELSALEIRPIKPCN